MVDNQRANYVELKHFKHQLITLLPVFLHCKVSTFHELMLLHQYHVQCILTGLHLVITSLQVAAIKILPAVWLSIPLPRIGQTPGVYPKQYSDTLAKLPKLLNPVFAHDFLMSRATARQTFGALSP